MRLFKLITNIIWRLQSQCNAEDSLHPRCVAHPKYNNWVELTSKWRWKRALTLDLYRFDWIWCLQSGA